MKKIISILLCSIILLSTATTTFANNQSSEEFSISIDMSEIQHHGELIDGKLTFRVPLDTNNDTLREEYIVFSMTKRAIYWTLVEFDPFNEYTFSGEMDITNLTTGFHEGATQSMSGVNGSASYNGLSGHTYLMTFHGNVFKAENGTATEFYAKANGGHTWDVPYN